MQRGRVQSAPGISRPAAGELHAYEWTLLSQSINKIPQALKHTRPAHAKQRCPCRRSMWSSPGSTFSPPDNAKPDQSCIDSVWFCKRLHPICPPQRGVRKKPYTYTSMSVRALSPLGLIRLPLPICCSMHHIRSRLRFVRHFAKSGLNYQSVQVWNWWWTSTQVPLMPNLPTNGCVHFQSLMQKTVRAHACRCSHLAFISETFMWQITSAITWVCRSLALSRPLKTLYLVVWAPPFFQSDPSWLLQRWAAGLLPLGTPVSVENDDIKHAA